MLLSRDVSPSVQAGGGGVFVASGKAAASPDAK